MNSIKKFSSLNFSSVNLASMVMALAGSSYHLLHIVVYAFEPHNDLHELAQKPV